MTTQTPFTLTDVCVFGPGPSYGTGTYGMTLPFRRQRLRKVITFFSTEKTDNRSLTFRYKQTQTLYKLFEYGIQLPTSTMDRRSSANKK